MQLSSLCSSKNGNFRNRFFFYIVAIHNDQMSYVTHVFHRIHVLFTAFGCLDGGKGTGAQPA